MKINWKTLLQATIPSIIVVALLSIFLFYPMLNSIETKPQGLASVVGTHDDSFVSQVIIGLIYVSVLCFLVSTATFYFIINYLKKRKALK